MWMLRAMMKKVVRKVTLVCGDYPCYDAECHDSLTGKGVIGIFVW